MSAFGPKALDVACRIADGFITTKPDAESVATFRRARGGDAPTQAGFKVAWGPSRDEAIDTAYELWPNSGVPGELSQVLPSPQHFEQAGELVTREKFAEKGAFGPDVADHVKAYRPFVEAGFDDVYVANMGPHYADMIAAYGAEVLPELRSASR
jgi:G6PDH family F420-dependent oxidoreductase